MKVEAESINLPAIMVDQPIGSYFITKMDWETLERITYSDIRRISERDVERYLGIQRPLKTNRVKEIGDYIYYTKDASFPTSVIIAVDERCATFDDKTQSITLGEFHSEDQDYESDIPFEKIGKVLDGQHRIAGFTKLKESHAISEPIIFELNVAIFIGIDLPEQAKIFATVNLAQTKVSRSLVYDLEDLAKSRSPHKTCHHIAIALDRNNKSPFFKRIKRLGVKTPGRSYEPLTQAAFVEALTKLISDDPSRDRNDIIARRKLRQLDQTKFPLRKFFEEGTDKGDLIIYDIVLNYFGAVKEKWPNAWRETEIQGNLLPKSNTFVALMRYLKDRAYTNAVFSNEKSVPEIDDFLKTLEHVQLEDADFTTEVFVPGSGGQSMFYKVLIGELKATDILQ